MTEENFKSIKNSIAKQKKAIEEMDSLADDSNGQNPEKRQMALSHVKSLKEITKNEGNNTLKNVDRLKLSQQLPRTNKVDSSKYNKDDLDRRVFEQNLQGEKQVKRSFFSFKKNQLEEIEKETLSRLKTEEESEIPRWLLVQKAIVIEEKEKPRTYIKMSNRLFSKLALATIKKDIFQDLQNDLVKSGINILPKSYISMMFFTTLISFFAAIFIFAFFLFFNFGAQVPFITRSYESLLTRTLKTFWILFAIPIVAFFSVYFYPSTEKDSLEKKINQELPFATINMAAISGSLQNPTKIFSIIILTKDYPTLEKEFLKIINGVNVMGYDLITILKNSAFNSPSKKLRDLLNGLATTISSGGDLAKFFDERAKSLLFEYNLQKEKNTRAAETFMDIYISVVVAAPMILMLLLIIMQVSGLGLALSTSSITLLVVAGVFLVNIIFLAFLQIKQRDE
ncbi:type II secretion system F family protein [Candidatus Pacearchaeota archaeon]|nr:type II secretion system F family protein [Candidatus Pacearchaeota archaeon]